MLTLLEPMRNDYDWTRLAAAFFLALISSLLSGCMEGNRITQAVAAHASTKRLCFAFYTPPERGHGVEIVDGNNEQMQVLVDAGMLADETYDTIYGKKTIRNLSPKSKPFQGAARHEYVDRWPALCVGSGEFVRLENYTTPASNPFVGGKVSVVTYSVRFVNFPDWALTQAARKAFPAIDAALSGTTYMMKDEFIETSNGWVHVSQVRL